MTSLQPTRHHIPSLWVLVDAQIVNIIMNNGFYYILICNIIPFREDQEMVDSRLRFPYITSLSPKWKFGENERKMMFYSKLNLHSCNQSSKGGVGSSQELQYTGYLVVGFPEVPLQHMYKEYKYFLCLCVAPAFFMVSNNSSSDKLGK